MIVFKNLFLTFLFVIFSRAKFQIERLNKRERERKSWNLLTFCEWGGYNNKKKIRANKTFLENDYWVHSIWQVEVKSLEREREGGTLGVGKFNHTCCGVCLARESKVKSASSAREIERGTALLIERRASIAIGWEQQSYLLLLRFPL